MFQVVKSVISGVFDVFASGRHGRKHCAGGNHARSIGEATPQSACSAGRRSRSATLSTTGGARGQGGFWVGLGEHDCRFQIGYFKMIKVLFRGKCSAGTPDGADTGRNGREAALDMTTPHPQSLSPLRGEGSQWRRDPHLGRFGYERNRL